MAHEPNPLLAIVKSKKFQVLLGWTVFMGFMASRVNSEQAVALLSATSWVAAAYLVGQSLVDAVALYVGKNGEE